LFFYKDKVTGDGSLSPYFITVVHRYHNMVASMVDVDNMVENTVASMVDNMEARTVAGRIGVLRIEAAGAAVYSFLNSSLLLR